jgi:hypothetical protein
VANNPVDTAASQRYWQKEKKRINSKPRPPVL